MRIAEKSNPENVDIFMDMDLLKFLHEDNVQPTKIILFSTKYFWQNVE